MTITLPTPVLRPTLLELRQARGLMDPCPNCQVANWRHRANTSIECGGCGWLDYEMQFVRPCRCADCTRGLGPQKPIPATRGHLQHVAAGYLCRVVDDAGEDVQRVTMNSYDISGDRWLHNVRERELARVVCAVKAAIAPQRYTGADVTYRRGGDMITHGWEILDCYEWQQEREARRRTPVEIVPPPPSWDSPTSYTNFNKPWMPYAEYKALRDREEASKR